MKSAEGKVAMLMAMAGAMGGDFSFMAKQMFSDAPSDSNGRKEFYYPPFEGGQFFRVLAFNQQSADAQYEKIAKKKGITLRPRVSGKEFNHLAFRWGLKSKIIGGLCLVVHEGKYHTLEKAADNKIEPNDLYYTLEADKVSIMSEELVGSVEDPNTMDAYKLIPVVK